MLCDKWLECWSPQSYDPCPGTIDWCVLQVFVVNQFPWSLELISLQNVEGNVSWMEGGSWVGIKCHFYHGTCGLLFMTYICAPLEVYYERKCQVLCIVEINFFPIPNVNLTHFLECTILKQPLLSFHALDSFFWDSSA